MDTDTFDSTSAESFTAVQNRKNPRHKGPNWYRARSLEYAQRAIDPSQLNRKKRRRRKVPFKQKYLDYIKSPRWQDFRERIIRERGYRCESKGCGATNNIELHHLNYHRLGKELPQDVRLLCKKCHKEVHGKQ